VQLRPGWKPIVDPAWVSAWDPRPLELERGVTDLVVAGEGAPLLLLPPLPGYKEAWLAVVPRLASHFRVVTWDLRGRWGGPQSWEAHLRDLERVADREAPGRAWVVGHSLGGALAQHWALARPDRIAGLVLSSSFARVTTAPGHWRKRYVEQLVVLASQRWLPERWAAALARRFAADGAWVLDPRCDERLLAFVRHCIRTQPIAEAKAAVGLALAHDTRARLPTLRVPTLLLVGDRESAWAQRATAELTALIPGAELERSPGASHLHPLSSADWFADTVRAWTARVATRAAPREAHAVMGGA
jgi:pimeloyl-ACP methyl ester carboxylesterase